MQKLNYNFKDSSSFYKSPWKLLFSLTFLIGAIHSGTIQAQSQDSATILQNRETCSSEDLHSSVKKNLVDCVYIFITQEPTQLNRKDGYGYTPLHLAVDRGHKSIVELLIKHGADINRSNNKWNKPLHTAVWFGHEEIIKLLINYGADINAKNDRNETPLDLARQREHHKIIQFLLTKEAVEGGKPPAPSWKEKRLLRKGIGRKNKKTPRQIRRNKKASRQIRRARQQQNREQNKRIKADKKRK